MNVSPLLIPPLSVAKLSFGTRPVYDSKNGCRNDTSEEAKSGYLDDCATNPRMTEIYFAILLFYQVLSSYHPSFTVLQCLSFIEKWCNLGSNEFYNFPFDSVE